jgi:hypothetical protein
VIIPLPAFAAKIKSEAALRPILKAPAMPKGGSGFAGREIRLADQKIR